MTKSKKSDKIPKAMPEKFDRIVAITDDFSQQHLNDEYAQLIRAAIAALCRKRPSPLASGKDHTWACVITHAIGMVNFLFDSSQDPHISAGELYKRFGVGASTGQAKSKQVRDTLKMRQMDPEWCLPSRIDSNPMVWLLSVNGFMVDVRTMPREVQEIALAKGLIPYIPGESEALEESAEPAEPVTHLPTAAALKSIYTLEVFLMNGPVTEAFVAKNPEISRIIEIKGSHTLADLHRILFKAFDREEEHLYEFQVGGSGPQDPKAKRYGLKQSLDEGLAGEVSTTKIASLGLSVDQRFGYWFDFGDDWWHQVNVVSISDPAPKKKYPRIISRVGNSPPQYAEFDE
ncbi:MAG: plasmid pRiA4b ORF-3 family protein [Thermosynechococcaceae cyanobacterium]